MANKAPKPSALAPGIYPVIDHATPDIRDTIVYLEVDSRLGNYKQPEYGSKYAGPRGHLRNDPWAEEGTTPEKIGRFDNHELVHVSLADERGMVRWYYARRREDQAFYNWEYSTPGQNADGYPTYTRTYFVHRDDLADYYDEYPATPAGGEHLSLGDTDPDLSYTPQFYGFEYSDTQIGRVGDENLDALYVLVVRRFQLLCDKVTQTESETYGTVTSTVVFDDNVQNSYELASEYPAGSGKYIIDLTEKFIGCSDEYRRVDISTVAIPTLPNISERVDKEFCNITTKRWVDFDASRHQTLGTVLPVIGSADPTDPTRIVVDSSLESIGQSTLAVFTVSYGVFPTEPVSTIREDQQYCRINTESYYALGDTTDLPAVGEVLEGGDVVVDATAQDISCGDVRKFSVSTAVIPTPVVTTETLNNDYCRVISETNYDLRTNIGDLPEYGDAHPTETGYQVIEAQLDDVGCGELTKRSVSYATVPTSPVTDEVDDPQFCKMYKERFYDLSTNFTLPTKGDPYKSVYVVLDSSAVSQGCGDLMQFQISYASLPTPVVVNEVLNRDFCRVITETNYDLKGNIGALPLYGDSHPTEQGYQVTDASLEDIGCGEVSKKTISYATVPTTPVIDEVDDDQFCKTFKERFYDLSTNYTLPVKGDAYKSTYTVLDAQANALGCGDLKQFTITYASLPTPVVETEILNRDYCRVITQTNYDLKSSIGALPSYGDSHPTETGYQVIEASLEDIGCGEVSKQSVSYATVPTDPVTDEMDDPQFCKMFKERFYDLSSNYTLPTKGDAYKQTYTVLDSKATAVGCGDLMQFEISYATLPTPVVANEILNRDFCRVITETNFDLKSNIGSLPTYGDNHPTEIGYQVTEATLEDIGCGEVSKKMISYATVPTLPVTDEVDDPEFCKTYKERFYDLSANYTLPTKGDVYKSSYTVLDAKADALGCGDLKQFTITYATLPTPVVTKEDLDNDYCVLYTESNYDLKSNIGALPIFGDAHPAKQGFQVVRAALQDIGCGEVSKLTVTYANVPTSPKTTERDDESWCRVITDQFFELSANYTLPAKGDIYPSGNTTRVINASTDAVGCGDLYRFTIEYASLPTPVVTTETLNRDYCRVITESNYDLNSSIGALPTYGDSHPTETGYQVIEATLEDIGCGEVAKQSVSYATVPTQPVIDEMDDPQYCKMYKERFYDLSTNYTLPDKGDSYKTSHTVLDSKATAVGCGDLMRFEISYATLPTPVVVSEVLNRDYCRVISETNYDLKSNIGALPAYGDAHTTQTGYQVIEASLEDIGCGQVTKQTVSYATVPTQPVIDERDDAQFCKTYTERFYDLGANYTLPTKGSVYETDYNVIDAKAEAAGCGDLYKFEITYASMPTPVVETEVLNKDYCRVISETNYDLKGSIGSLPQYGDSHASEPGYQVIEASLEDIGCGEVTKRSISYANVPTAPRVNQIDDPEFCRVSEAFFYDLLANFDLPAKGDAYSGGYVIDAKADAVGCGDLMRFSIKYAALPTPVVTTESLHEEHCNLITETNYALKSAIGTMPSNGDANTNDSTYRVVDATIQDIGCGEVAKRTIVYAPIPSTKRKEVTESPEWGSLTQETYFDVDTATLLTHGDAYGGGYVIESQRMPQGCGVLAKYTIFYAALPTAKNQTTRQNDAFCLTTTDTWHALDTEELPSKGDAYATGHVIDSIAEDVNLGPVRRFTVTYATLPTPTVTTKSTSDEWCDTYTDTHYDLAASLTTLAGLGSAGETGYVVVDAKIDDIGCGDIRKSTVTYAAVPSEKRTTESEHPEYCTLFSDTFYELEGYELPVQGDTYLGGYVVNAQATDINCGAVRRISVEYITLPTSKRYQHREDDTYCGVETEQFLDLDTYTTPGLGTVYGAGTVIDVSSRDIGCGGITEYSITSGVIPSPKKISIRTDDERCRIQSETFVDVESYTLPLVDSAHPTDTDLKVVNTNQTPLGCRGISNYEITYAVIPSPPRESEREDDRWGRVTEYTFYDLEGAAPLPSVGTTYEGQTVVSAVAQDVNCGTLRRYVVGTILLPTPTKLRTSEDERFCLLTTESFFDLSTYALPSRGATHNGSPVIDSTSLDINCGGITEYTITTGQVPSPIKTSERTDDDLCRIITESFTSTETAYTLPILDSDHPTITGLKVVNTAATPYGCGGIFAYDVTYAQIPSPAKTNLIEDAEYGRVSIDTFYVNDQYVLLSHGAPYGGGYILSAKKDEVNCGTLIKVEYRYVTLPTSKKYVEREDREFCTLEDEVHYDLDTHVLPVAGSLHTNGSYVLEATAQDIDLGSIRKFSLTTTELPTNTQVSERKDDDMCTIHTESFYHTDTVYVQPAIGSDLSTNTLLKCISSNKDPYGCGDIYKYTNAYAQIPSPPRSSEYDDPRYCRVDVDVYYDLEGDAALPSIGDVYPEGGNSKVVEAKAMDVDCDGIRKYEVHYVALPIVNTSESADSTYCTTTKTETYELTSTLGSLPGQGTDNTNGQTILEVTRDAIGCGTISKQTEISTTLPSPALTTISSDDNFCEIQTKVLYDKSTANFPAVGATGGLGFVIDKRVTPTGCGGVVRHEETTAAVPSPLTTVTNSDNKYCSITEYRQIVLEGSTLDYTIGDTLADSSIVVDYQQRIYKCDQFVIESYKAIDALPTEVKTASYESPDYCDANIDTFFDLSTSQQPIVGDSRGTAGQVVVQITQKPVCGDLVEFEIRYAQIGPAFKKTSEGINDLFCSVSNISYVEKTADVPGYARGDADPDDAGAVVIEYSTTPLGCGILSRVNYTVGTVPSDLLEGHRINQVTGKLEDFSKKVIKNTDVSSEKKDVDADGNYTSIQPYGCGLSLAETANIRPFETLEYETTIQYTFPRVLTRIDLFIWPLKKGGNEIYPQFLWKKIGYSGPVKARVVEEWHLVKPAALVPIVLMPGVLVYNSPAFRVSTPPCLHGQILFKADYGTNDKKYAFTYNSNWTVNATTYTDWPTEEFLAAWSARPAYGGYISKSVYVTAPPV